MSLKKWFDCKLEVTVIQIYGMRSFNFLHLILILYRHLGRPWAGSWWNGHNKCLFPLWGTLFSTPSPQKNQKTNSDHHFGKKRGLYFELEREKTIRRYKNIYFNGHLWCKYHTYTTSIPTKSPSLSMKVHVLTNNKCLSKSRQRLELRIFH